MPKFLHLAPLLLTLSGTPALAQDIKIPVPPELQGMVGTWVLEQEDPGLTTCPMTLTDTQAPGGWAITLPQPCPAPFPPQGSLLA